MQDKYLSVDLASSSWYQGTCSQCLGQVRISIQGQGHKSKKRICVSCLQPLTGNLVVAVLTELNVTNSESTST